MLVGVLLTTVKPVAFAIVIGSSPAFPNNIACIIPPDDLGLKLIPVAPDPPTDPTCNAYRTE